MGINIETGEVTDEQYKVPAEQRFRVLGNFVKLEYGEAYIHRDDLAVDGSQEGALWADPSGVVYTPEEAQEGTEDGHKLVRIFKTAAGLLIEAMGAPFINDTELHEDRRLTTHYDYDFEEHGWEPVIDVIDTEEKLTAFGFYYHQEHGEFLGASVLANVETES